MKSFETLNEKLTATPIIVAPDWELLFELMCDTSNYAIGAILGQRNNKVFFAIYYASRMLNKAQLNYAMTKKELLAIVFVFDKFRSYLIRSKIIVFTDHSTIKYLMTKNDAKPKLVRWVFLLKEFDVEIKNKKGFENLLADHLLRLEIPKRCRRLKFKLMIHSPMNKY